MKTHNRHKLPNGQTIITGKCYKVELVHKTNQGEMGRTIKNDQGGVDGKFVILKSITNNYANKTSLKAEVVSGKNYIEEISLYDCFHGSCQKYIWTPVD